MSSNNVLLRTINYNNKQDEDFPYLSRVLRSYTHLNTTRVHSLTGVPRVGVRVVCVCTNNIKVRRGSTEASELNVVVINLRAADPD